MKFLITGGAGFIGSHLTESLLADQHRVAVIDDFSTGSPENLSSVSGNPYLEVIEEDITASPHLEQLVREADCIIHLAAAVGVELVAHNPHQCRRNGQGPDLCGGTFQTLHHGFHQRSLRQIRKTFLSGN